MYDFTQLNVLYVEDEPELRDHVGYALRLHIDTVVTAANGQEALEMIRLKRPDIVISDIRMPVMGGLELTAALRQKYPAMPVLLCTAFNDTEYLLKAIELGVAAYIPKPIDTGRLLAAIRQAALPILQRLEIGRLKTAALKSSGLMLGGSPAIKTVGEQILKVAESDYSVVVRGEAGTGKSAVAELIHGLSGRRTKRFLTIDCRSRSAEQLEAELFGRLPGRGRSSAARDAGVLSDIDGGTLAFDAPELLPLPLQGRILALLEKRAYLPTGCSESLQCDVRVIALTLVDLNSEAAAGRFNQSLWLRLSDVVVSMPPLRERREDIPLICSTFLAQAADDLGCACPSLAPDAIAALQHEPWPGNFRQLKQFLRRAVFYGGAVITADDVGAAIVGANNHSPQRDEMSFKLTDLEKGAIQKALRATGGKKMQAAELLGISYNAFKEKSKRHRIM